MPAKTKENSPTKMMLQLSITLQRVKPKVTRSVLVSANLTFKQLHDVIQVAMGWKDDHLHEFEVGSERIGTSQDEAFGGEAVLPEDKHQLGKKLAKLDKFRYWYDFGDDWRHEITIQKRLQANADEPPVSLLGGKNACPPEDCGGPWGYAALCAALADPAHPDHEEMLEWVGEEFDPKHFDQESSGKNVSRYASFLAAKNVTKPQESQ